ncbi:VTC domain-containing protein [Gammaproteobacteria bacterium]|nr:VTC domain-containing protein [Gammaproteobacteria bacterium]
MSFRKEKKYKLTASGSHILRSELLNLGMEELYPRRIISSQYFDTLDFRMFSESEEGLLPRKKIRVRWYNSNSNVLSMEEKTSSIEGRFKTSGKIDTAYFERIKEFGLHHGVYGAIKPSVLISYERMYYTYQGARITFDSNISYQHSCSHHTLRDFETVVEMKVPIDAPDGFCDQILPVPTSRFSKYCRAFLLRKRSL